MSTRPLVFLLGLISLSACALPPPPMALPGPGGNFAAFGEDEETCRKAGAAAIQPGDATDAQAASAHQYDYAYQRCMFEHGRSRQMRAMSDAVSNDAGPRENLHSFDYPDAFYSIPYATPGYGYDGFSYR